MKGLIGRLIVCFTAFCAGFTMNSRAADETKIAVYLTDPSSDSLADLLTAELSGLKGVAVLERREWNKVLQEQSIASFSSSSLAGAGALLHANGIVILDARKISAGYAIGVRLVSVSSGAVIAWWNQTIKTENIGGWAKDTSGRLETYLPKLKARSLPAISFIGFNSPSSTRESALLERQLNSLLIARVSAEPDLLVLERQKLLDAAFEKVLGLDDRKFWNGSYLLDGTINPTAIDPEFVALQGRLRFGNESREFTIRAKTTDLSTLAEGFVHEVRKIVQPNVASTAKPFDAAVEADKFLQQAQNELKWGLFREARFAAESAFALGRTENAVRNTRLEACTGLCKPELRNIWLAFTPGFGVIEHYPAPPTTEILEAALELSYQLEDALLSGMNLFETTNQSAVNGAIAAIGDVTFQYYIGAELRRQKEEMLAELRGSMRHFMGDALSAGAINKYPGETFDLFEKFGPLWFETPEDGINFLRKVKTAPNRRVYFSTSAKYSVPDWLPPLAGWKWADRARADKLWEDFNREEEMVRLLRTRIFAIGQSENDSAVKTNLEAALSFARTNQVGLNAIGYKMAFAGLLENLWSYQRDLMPPDEVAEDEKRFVEPLKTILLELQNASASYPALPEAVPARRFGRLPQKVERMLGEGKIPTIELIQGFQWIPQQDISRAIEVLTHLLKMPDSPEKEAILPEAEKRLTQLRQGRTGFPGIPNMSFQNEQIRLRNEALAKLKMPPDRPICALSNVLALPTSIPFQVWEKPETVGGKLLGVGAEYPNVLAVDWVEDRLWSFYSITKQRLYSTERGSGSEFVDERGLAAFTPSRISASPIPIPEKFFGKYGHVESAELAAFSDVLIVNLRDNLLIYDRRSGAFRSMPPPIKSAHMFRVGNRLFLKNSESILETSSALAKFEVMASNRRTPPHNPLDRLPNLEAGQIVAGPDFAVYFSMGNALFVSKEGTWSPADPAVLADFRPAFEMFARHSGEPFAGNFGSSKQSFSAVLPSRMAHETDLRFEFARTDHWMKLPIAVPMPSQLLANNLLWGVNLSTTADGMYFWGSSLSGVFYIAGADFTTSLKTIKSRQDERIAADAQRLSRALNQFDLNKNGKLDPAELGALASEPILFNCVWSSIDQDKNGAINDVEFAFFDFNHDRQMQPEEHRAFLNAVAYSAAAAFKSADEDGDGFLSAKERNKLFISVSLWTKHASNTNRCSLAEWTDLQFELGHRGLVGRFPVNATPFAGDETFLGTNFLTAVFARFTGNNP